MKLAGSRMDIDFLSWRTQRRIAITIVVFSAFALLFAFLIYGRLNNIVLTSETFKMLTEMAIVLYITLLMTLTAIAFGIYRIYKSERLKLQLTNDSTSTTSIIVKALSGKKYSTILQISAIGYGLFYAFITGLLVYRPNEVFSQIYGVSVPSWHIVPCCGTSGYLPVFVAYITEQFGLLVIPLNLILLLVVSSLVGINIALAVFAYDNRPKNANVNWFGGFGAITGLFTGCPTCAGTFFVSMFGIGAGTSALALAPVQSLFIGISIPVLLVTPILLAKNIHGSLYGTCSLDNSKGRT